MTVAARHSSERFPLSIGRKVVSSGERPRPAQAKNWAIERGKLEKVVYSGMTGTPYSSVEQDYASGTLADTIYGHTDVTGQTATPMWSWKARAGPR
jgi:hypothetical protein